MNNYSGTKAEEEGRYAPFGMPLVGRNWVSGSENYRFGFNGKESDDETYGDGNVYDYGFRIYNPRLGKFLSVDPLARDFAYYSPYQFASNSPIIAVDLDGLESQVAIDGTIISGPMDLVLVNFEKVLQNPALTLANNLARVNDVILSSEDFNDQPLYQPNSDFGFSELQWQMINVQWEQMVKNQEILTRSIADEDKSIITFEIKAKTGYYQESVVKLLGVGVQRTNGVYEEVGGMTINEHGVVETDIANGPIFEESYGVGIFGGGFSMNVETQEVTVTGNFSVLSATASTDGASSVDLTLVNVAKSVPINASGYSVGIEIDISTNLGAWDRTVNASIEEFKDPRAADYNLHYYPIDNNVKISDVKGDCLFGTNPE